MKIRSKIGGHLVTLAPQGLRRSYARILYQAGIDPGKIQQNMGRENIQTTFDYIGVLNASDRDRQTLSVSILLFISKKHRQS